jgi:hypothetical protein
VHEAFSSFEGDTAQVKKELLLSLRSATVVRRRIKIVASSFKAG